MLRIVKRAKKDQPEKPASTEPARTRAPKPDPSPVKESNPAGDAPRRLHLYFSGTVQGVGFRYSAQSIAERFGINGWVRNCSDGRVELMAEGRPSVLESYLTALGDEMSGYIRKVDRTWEEPTGEWSQFSIASSA